jgi:hypothetical protein
VHPQRAQEREALVAKLKSSTKASQTVTIVSFYSVATAHWYAKNSICVLSQMVML